MKFNTGAITLFLSLALKVYGKGYPCEVYSVVHSGDSCNDFAYMQNEYYIRMKDLLAYNPLIDCDHLKEGQKVCIKPADLEMEDRSKTGVYHIQESDTYEGIAEKLGTTPEVLERINDHTYNPKLGDASKQTGNEVIYRLDKCYEPDFSKSEEYVIPKHSSKATTTKKSITKTVTKKRTTTKTSTKKRTTKTSTTKTSTKSSHHTSSSHYRCDKHVVVKKGYTCSKIYTNKNINISYKKFMKLNPHITCSDLQIGEKVCVSSSKAGHEKDPNFDKSKRVYLH